MCLLFLMALRAKPVCYREKEGCWWFPWNQAGWWRLLDQPVRKESRRRKINPQVSVSSSQCFEDFVPHCCSSISFCLFRVSYFYEFLDLKVFRKTFPKQLNRWIQSFWKWTFQTNQFKKELLLSKNAACTKRVSISNSRKWWTAMTFKYHLEMVPSHLLLFCDLGYFTTS